MDFGLLLIIVFILAPLLEKLLASGRKGQDQPPPLPGQRRPGQRVPGAPPRRSAPDEDEDELPFRSVPTAQQRDEDEAAAMLPDDLWEILTGERRPRPGPAPQEPVDAAPPAPVPPPVERRPELARRQERRPDRLPGRTRESPVPRSRERPVDLRDRTPRERDPERLRPSRPPSTADAQVRPEHVREERPVAARQERVATVRKERVFAPREVLSSEERHTRFHERLDRSAAAAAAAAVTAPPQVYRFEDAADLRRAIVMAEVLGKPKGLE